MSNNWRQYLDDENDEFRQIEKIRKNHREESYEEGRNSRQKNKKPRRDKIRQPEQN